MNAYVEPKTDLAAPNDIEFGGEKEGAPATDAEVTLTRRRHQPY
jgi:hypothetical protein